MRVRLLLTKLSQTGTLSQDISSRVPLIINKFTHAPNAICIPSLPRVLRPVRCLQFIATMI
ncbi:hypothetical protein M404DRAFT_1001769 [Pisolithus tinctorius Marx 270]|uniref:Uncharacterized protein n=1 Tax=Pisolithus tinctorius Marx 270 TaxID=870435 RepID=A0A0C3P6E7_PISTI|nr:hypothetical protein M404DRAFT_1001769 [Pisolithus tinctorius Marx 270]